MLVHATCNVAVVDDSVGAVGLRAGCSPSPYGAESMQTMANTDMLHNGDNVPCAPNSDGLQLGSIVDRPEDLDSVCVYSRSHLKNVLFDGHTSSSSIFHSE